MKPVHLLMKDLFWENDRLRIKASCKYKPTLRGLYVTICRDLHILSRFDT